MSQAGRLLGRNAPTLNGPNALEIWKPIIAALHGHVVGGGCETALACDIRIAAEGTRIGLAEVRRGLIPGTGGIQRLTRHLAFGDALKILFTGEWVTPEEALRIGLVQEVVKEGEDVKRAIELAEQIAENAPLAVRAVKEAAYRGYDLPLRAAIAQDQLFSFRNRQSEDSREGMQAFLEKRRRTSRGSDGHAAERPGAIVNITFTPEQVDFRAEVRAFLAREVTPELHAQTLGAIEAHVPAFYEKLAINGWIGLTWPKDTEDRPATDMAIFYEEMGGHLAPLGRYVATTVFVGGSILSYGSQEQKTRFMPGIARGQLLGSLGMTEPESGSDASSLRTAARRDGDRYVVNGEKIFISGADKADRILTAVRTSTEGRSNREGISLLLVAGNAAGLTVRPIGTVAGLRVNAVHFDDVSVPAGDLLGQEGNGWRHVQTTSASSVPCPVPSSSGALSAPSRT